MLKSLWFFRHYVEAFNRAAFFGGDLVDGDVAQPASPSLADYLMACEQDYLKVALDRHDWHMTNTAPITGKA